MTLKPSVMILQALLNSAASLTSLTSMPSTASTALFHQKTPWSWWFDHQWHKNIQSEIQIFTEIWHPSCQRMLRLTYVTFLKTGWWNSNVQTLEIYRYLQTKSSLHISICESQFIRYVSIWDTLYLNPEFCKILRLFE